MGLKMSLRVGLLCVCLVLSGMAAAAVVPGVPEALARAEQALVSTPVRGDTGFLVNQGARRLGREVPLTLAPGLEEKRNQYPYNLEYTLWKLRLAAMPRLFYAVPSPGQRPFDPVLATGLRKAADGQKRFAEQGGLVFALMRGVLTCDRRMAPRQLVGEPDYEYVSTHQLLALGIALQRGCLTRPMTEQVIGDYAARVRDEFLLEQASSLTDLQLERAAVLCLVGQCAQVPRKFIQRVAQAQSPDGVWRLEDPLVKVGLIPHEHASALAYCLLAHAGAAGP